MISTFIAQLGVERTYGGMIGVVILFLQLAVIVSIVAGRGTTRHKLVWSLIVLLLPVIGLVLYFLIGRSRADRPLLD